jgi:catechol 2,3-dioxygenase-like lactoylglutathione lyase family enzyme
MKCFKSTRHLQRFVSIRDPIPNLFNSNFEICRSLPTVLRSVRPLFHGRKNLEANRLHRGRLIDHIQLVVRDLDASKIFYKAVMSVLDIPVFSTDNGYFVADELIISSTDSPTAAGELTGRHHLAFQARDRATVDTFYNVALAHGGHDNGAPGVRAYHPGYYAAFVLDPDGNNIEAVYQGEAKRNTQSVIIEF